MAATPADPYRAVFDAAPDGILLVDSKGTIVEANPQALRLFGYSVEELVGESIEALVPATLRGVHRTHRNEYLENPRARPMGIGMELSGLRSDGVRIPVEISLSPVPFPEGPRVIAVVRDLTERRRLKGFGIAAIEAAEEERRRIARELHDDTAQTLVALLMRLSALQRRPEVEALAEDLEALRDGLQDAVEGVRRIARGLRPPELQDVGLAAALRSFVRSLPASGKVDLELDGSEALLGPDRSLAVYRIAQEATSNAIRHAGAERIGVGIRLEPEGRQVRLEVADDGAGFDLEAIESPGGGLGLIGMEERAQSVGGRLDVDSEPGGGTRVRVYFPVQRTATREEPDG